MWEYTIGNMLRVIINDSNPPYKYDDEYIKRAIVVSGMLVSQDFPFKESYQFNLADFDITPDPYKDSAFISLVALKSACMIQTNAYQDASNDRVRVKDGDITIDQRTNNEAHRDIIEMGPCKLYKETLRTKNIQKVQSYCQVYQGFREIGDWPPNNQGGYLIGKQN